MQGEIKIVVDEKGAISVGASPALAGNLILLLGLLDVARESFHQQARAARIETAKPDLAGLIRRMKDEARS